MIRFYGGALTELGEREVGVVASTPQLGRDGMIVEPAGIDLTSYRKNPVVLWQHDPTAPIGACRRIGVANGDLAAQIEFAPTGVSPLADQICGMCKAGIVNAVSIGFDPKESRPLDPQRPRGGGQRVTRAELLEISFVAVGADYGAMVTQRSFGATAFRALRSIPDIYVQRAAARVSTYARSPIFSPTIHTWLLVEQRRRDHEAIYGFEARQAERRRLSPK
jgi:HK97 family phage prohead protease